MTLVAGLLVLLVLGIPLAISMARANELFVVRILDGRARLSRGRIPQRLLDDIDDIAQRPVVRSAVVRAVHEDGRPRVLASGELSDAQQQQLRNVVGLWPLAKLRAGGRRK